MDNKEQNEITDETLPTQEVSGEGAQAQQDGITQQETDKRTNNTRKKVTDILTTVIEAALIALLLNWFVFSLIEVNKTSMYPTLNDADVVFLTKISYWFSGPDSGDIIVFAREQQDGSKINYVKRVIGLPGDVIEIRDGEVYRNGIKLDEPYINEKTEGIYKCEVPEGKYYVLGDNRNVSLDSKNEIIGLVDESEILGKVVFKTKPFGKIEKYDHSDSDRK